VIALAGRGVRVVLLDIEGTTTPIAFVHEVLFPYARARIGAEWHAAMDRDDKSGELKRRQGLIWEQGYRAGELHGEVFPDVAPAIRRWRAAGLRVAIYSSGSELAQRLLFGSTPDGDLTALIDGFFDTAVGPKKSASSYADIARRLECAPREILFVSDVTAELAAAAEAGCQVVLSVRPGNAPQPDAGRYEAVESFDELDGAAGL
jgi:enolase-phosphatase E1